MYKETILIVDDESDIREILQFNIENEGYEIDQAESAEQALILLASKDYNLLLLDVMMEGMSGFRLAEKLRKSGNNIPIIFLTAKKSENDMLTGFSIGADDYISKPFSIREVIARIKTVLKRSQILLSENTKDNILNVRSLSVNLDLKQITIDNNIVDLTKKEFEILVLLIQNPAKIFSRELILEKIWKSEVVLDRTIDVHIARLRKKIGVYGDYIINRTGYGYCFNIINYDL